MKIDKKDHTFIGINEITFTSVPWHRSVFWKQRTPWWNLCNKTWSKTFVILLNKKLNKATTPVALLR